MVHKAKLLGGSSVKSVTIKATGNGTQGSGHKRSCMGLITNMGFKTWIRGDINTVGNKAASLYGYDSDGNATLIANLLTTKEGTFENTALYTEYGISYNNNDDYGSADVSVTFNL